MKTGTRPRLSPVTVDWLMAVGTAAAFLGAAFISPEEASRDADSTALVFAFLLGAALLVRRRWPLGVYVWSMFAITAYMGMDYPAVGLAFPLAASAYTAASRDRARPGAWITAAAVLTGVVWRTAMEPEGPLLVVINMAQEGIGLAAALLLGETVRSRRALAVETQERLRLSRAEQEKETRQRLMEESECTSPVTSMTSSPTPLP